MRVLPTGFMTPLIQASALNHAYTTMPTHQVGGSRRIAELVLSPQRPLYANTAVAYVSNELPESLSSSGPAFSIGDNVVYPCQGVVQIEAISERTIHGTRQKFYELTHFATKRKYAVRITNAKKSGLRPLITPVDVSISFSIIREDSEIHRGRWLRFLTVLEEKFETGQATDMADIIRDLSTRKERKTKPLSYRERILLDKASNRLAIEIGLVIGRSTKEIRTMIEQFRPDSIDAELAAELTFQVDDLVFHPDIGVGNIVSVSQKDLGGTPQWGYNILPVENDTNPWVSVDYAEKKGLRRIVTKNEIQKLFETLRAEPKPPLRESANHKIEKDFKERARLGKAQDLAALIRDMHFYRYQPTSQSRSMGNKLLLEATLRKLSLEIATVTEREVDEVAQEIQVILDEHIESKSQ